jgi:PmbA protein
MHDKTERLLNAGQDIIRAALRHGADAADAAISQSRSRAVQVRLGKLEEAESSESDSLSLRVFVDRRVATVSADLSGDLDKAAERAVAMARVSPADPYAGLAEPDRLATIFPDLDLYDDTDIATADLIEQAQALEAAARSVAGVTNSCGASATCGFGGFVLVTSDGFSGTRARSAYSRSVNVIAGEGTAMQRDHDYDSRIHFSDLDAAEAIGRNAGERTVRRMSPDKIKTGRYPIVFDPRTARALVGHLVGAVNGAAIARGTSFLRKRMGTRILPETISVIDDPLLARGWGSRSFDGEGAAAAALPLVADGILANWLLDGATARELGLEPNGRASRSGGGVSPSSSNVILSGGQRPVAELLSEAEGGIYVTELIGHGADLVTGDYSRGASGFRIRGGQLAEPVAEFTIAGNLADMLLAISPGDDVDSRFPIICPTIAVGEMTVAGV